MYCPSCPYSSEKIIMASKKSKSAVILRAELVDEPRELWCTERTYKLILEGCIKKGVIDDTVRKPQEYKISSDDLHNKLRRILQYQQDKQAICLLIDFSSIPSTMGGYDHRCDDLCIALEQRINQIKSAKPDNAVLLDIIIVVSDLAEFSGSVLLKERLVQCCINNNIGLVLVTFSPEPQVVIRHDSGRLNNNINTNLTKIGQHMEDAKEVEENPEESIRSSIDTILGHFKIVWPKRQEKRQFHVPALVSLDKFSIEGNHLAYIRDIFIRELKGDDFIIYFFGIEDMKGLAQVIVNNDNTRLADTVNVKGRKVAIICDILWEVYELESFVQNLIDKGAEDVFVIGFAIYAKFLTKCKLKAKWFLELNFEEYQPGPKSCPFCQYENEKAIDGEYLKEFLGKIGKFETYSFWELISNTEGAFTNGHWPSERTGYHYLHRIIVGPILKKHGYGIACRIRNLLFEHVHSEWIDAIVCPDEPEAIRLSELLLTTLRLEHRRIVKIPRLYFSQITKTGIPDDLQSYLSKEYGNNFLEKWNVIIVDQAAHHFQTVSALSYLCIFRGARQLAFIVLVDRLDRRLPISEWLFSSHYISLYTWPWPPYKGDECPCTHQYNKEGVSKDG